MSLAVREERMSAEAFLDWHPDGEKLELTGGIPVRAMGGGGLHDAVKTSVTVAVGRRLRAPSSCRPGLDSRVVQIDGWTAYRPDVHINRALFGDPMDQVIEKPTVAVTSLGRDLLDKRANYFRHPDVEHVVIVNAVEQVVHHFRRGEGRGHVVGFHDTLSLDGTVSLDIPVAELFDFLPEGR